VLAPARLRVAATLVSAEAVVEAVVIARAPPSACS
jgi:hypothetical protein